MGGWEGAGKGRRGEACGKEGYKRKNGEGVGGLKGMAGGRRGEGEGRRGAR